MQTGAQPFSWLAYGSSMYVYTNGTEPDGVTSWPSAVFCYVGLPIYNSYFGNHTMTMLVDGITSQTAKYQLLFTGAASNYPGAFPADADYHIPNWYYYTQVYNPFSTTAPGMYSSGAPSYTDSNYPFQIYLRDDVFDGSSQELRVFDKGIGGNARWIGYITTPPGIIKFVHVAAHERGHQIIFQQGNAVGDGPIYSSQIGDSSDGDRVVDDWEDDHDLDRYSKDTTGAYDYNPNGTMNTAEPGDTEFLADIQELPVLFNQLSDWQEDWADGGIQKGNLLTNPAFISSGLGQSNHLTLRLLYTPVSVNTLTHTWTTGNTLWITNLADITTFTGKTPLTQLSDFMMCAPLLGWRHVAVTDRRTGVDFAQVIKTLVDEQFPDSGPDRAGAG